LPCRGSWAGTKALSSMVDGIDYGAVASRFCASMRQHACLGLDADERVAH